jgi:hypothetical protein
MVFFIKTLLRRLRRGNDRVAVATAFEPRATKREFAYVQVGLVPDAQLGSRKASARRTPARASRSVGCASPEQGSNGSGEQVNLSRLFHCFILSCSEKTALEEQAGAARSTDRKETGGMSLLC